jgi:hypothetical protein
LHTLCSHAASRAPAGRVDNRCRQLNSTRLVRGGSRHVDCAWAGCTACSTHSAVHVLTRSSHLHALGYAWPLWGNPAEAALSAHLLSSTVSCTAPLPPGDGPGDGAAPFHEISLQAA